MHEVSICQSIVDTVQNELDESEHANVREIHVRVGVLSSIEHKLLEHVFKFIIDGTAFSNCILHTELVEIVAGCENCSTNFNVENYCFVCPECGAPSCSVIQGNELTINKIIMEESTYAEVNQ